MDEKAKTLSFLPIKQKISELSIKIKLLVRFLVWAFTHSHQYIYERAVDARQRAGISSFVKNGNRNLCE